MKMKSMIKLDARPGIQLFALPLLLVVMLTVGSCGRAKDPEPEPTATAPPATAEQAEKTETEQKDVEQAPATVALPTPTPQAEDDMHVCLSVSTDSVRVWTQGGLTHPLLGRTVVLGRLDTVT